MPSWSKTSSTSERLKEAMRIRQLKQADLSRLTGLAKGGISNYVTGRYEPKSDVINKLAKALNCSEMWLWGYDVPMDRVNNTPPEEPQLSEGEKMWLQLYRRLSDETREILIESLGSMDNLTADQQQLAVDLFCVALRQKK
jgi:transcriptional regulator with XRE-family HTH domain